MGISKYLKNTKTIKNRVGSSSIPLVLLDSEPLIQFRWTNLKLALSQHNHIKCTQEFKLGTRSFSY